MSGDDSTERRFDKTQLELLRLDYQEAAADGRYRDRLLHSSYYLSLVLLGLLVNLGWELYTAENYAALGVLSAVAAFAYFVLSIWTASHRGARNGSWARRREIEGVVEAVHGNVLRSNRSATDRLTEANGEYTYGRKNWFERRSVGWLISKLLLVATCAWLVTSVVSVWWVYGLITPF